MSEITFIGKKIEATTWTIQDIASQSGNTRQQNGTVKVQSGTERKTLLWTANYLGEGRWAISGPGARLTTGAVVPNTRDYPWMIESAFNNGLRTILRDWLNHRMGQSGNNSGASAPTAVRPTNPLAQTTPAPVVPAVSRPVAKPIPPPRSLTPNPRSLPTPRPASTVLSQPTIPPTQGVPGMELVYASIAEIIAFRGETDDGSLGGTRIKSQPRVWFNPKKIKALGKSLSSPGEQQQPITVIRISDVPNKKFEIVDGERRWRSAIEAGMTHIWCFVRKPLEKRKQHLSALVANFCKEGHTHLELSRALALQYDEGRGVSVLELSEMLNLSPCLIYQSIALQKLIPELQAFLDPPVPRKERLRFECARILAKAPPERQMEYYREAKKEATPVLMKLRLRELCAEWLIKRGRKRQPSDYVPILRRIVSTTASDARLISDQSGTESVKLLSAGLKPEERAGFVRSLQAGISALQGLVDELEPKTEQKKK